MTGRLARMRIIVLALAFAALVPARAAAAGGPPSVYSSAGPRGIVSPDGASRYVTLSTRHGNLLVQISTNGGRLIDQRSLHDVHDGRSAFGIPSVASDGSPGGLSGDGRILVLGESFVQLRQGKTSFLILNAEGLDSTRRVTLQGAYTLDAVSPDGSKLYLTQYQPNFDPTAYAIRTYDVQTGRLLDKPVIDPSEPEERMRGFPVTRATSPDGRWAYTLYDGGTDTPFIHALDTAKGTAKCVDLDALGDLRGIRHLDLTLSADGSSLSVSKDSQQIAAMDTTTFAVTNPEPATKDGGSDSGPPWTLFAVAGVGAIAIAAAVRPAMRRRRRVAET